MVRQRKAPSNEPSTAVGAQKITEILTGEQRACSSQDATHTTILPQESDPVKHDNVESGAGADEVQGLMLDTDKAADKGAHDCDQDDAEQLADETPAHDVKEVATVLDGGLWAEHCQISKSKQKFQPTGVDRSIIAKCKKTVADNKWLALLSDSELYSKVLQETGLTCFGQLVKDKSEARSGSNLGMDYYHGLYTKYSSGAGAIPELKRIVSQKKPGALNPALVKALTRVKLREWDRDDMVEFMDRATKVSSLEADGILLWVAGLRPTTESQQDAILTCMQMVGRLNLGQTNKESVKLLQPLFGMSLMSFWNQVQSTTDPGDFLKEHHHKISCICSPQDVAIVRKASSSWLEASDALGRLSRSPFGRIFFKEPLQKCLSEMVQGILATEVASLCANIELTDALWRDSQQAAVDKISGLQQIQLLPERRKVQLTYGGSKFETKITTLTKLVKLTFYLAVSRVAVKLNLIPEFHCESEFVVHQQVAGSAVQKIDTSIFMPWKRARTTYNRMVDAMQGDDTLSLTLKSCQRKVGLIDPCFHGLAAFVEQQLGSEGRKRLEASARGMMPKAGGELTITDLRQKLNGLQGTKLFKIVNPDVQGSINTLVDTLLALDADREVPAMEMTKFHQDCFESFKLLIEAGVPPNKVYGEEAVQQLLTEIKGAADGDLNADKFCKFLRWSFLLPSDVVEEVSAIRSKWENSQEDVLCSVDLAPVQGPIKKRRTGNRAGSNKKEAAVVKATEDAMSMFFGKCA